jgi:hypothetical protein
MQREKQKTCMQSYAEVEWPCGGVRWGEGSLEMAGSIAPDDCVSFRPPVLQGKEKEGIYVESFTTRWTRVTLKREKRSPSRSVISSRVLPPICHLPSQASKR